MMFDSFRKLEQRANGKVWTSYWLCIGEKSFKLSNKTGEKILEELELVEVMRGVYENGCVYVIYRQRL